MATRVVAREEQLKDRIRAEQRLERAETVDAWLDPAASDGAAFDAFRRDALARRAHWDAFADGVPHHPGGRLVSFTFGPERLPAGRDAVVAWLREHPFVRRVEIP
jgi:hypothetical protein